MAVTSLALTEAQQRTERQLGDLTEEVRAPARAVMDLTNDVGKLNGFGLETRYRQHAGAFFGAELRRPHLLSNDELEDLLDAAVEKGALSQAEVLDILCADIIVRGKRRDDGQALVYMVVEVSWTIDADDVERAERRAALLAKTGVATLPAVAGGAARRGAACLAEALRVLHVVDSDAIRQSSSV